jgi:hypothetical protein
LPPDVFDEYILVPFEIEILSAASSSLGVASRPASRRPSENVPAQGVGKQPPALTLLPFKAERVVSFEKPELTTYSLKANLGA